MGVREKERQGKENRSAGSKATGNTSGENAKAEVQIQRRKDKLKESDGALGKAGASLLHSTIMTARSTVKERGGFARNEKMQGGGKEI